MKSKARAKKLRNRTLLHVVSGSIAAYKVGDLIQAMREEGARVICVMTPSAKHFVTPLVLRAVSGERVYDDFFSPDLPYGVVHTSLAEEADLILVAPASADFIARLSAGLADDLASCTILASRKPIVLAPAMNDQMLGHPLTQRNIERLKSIGYRFIHPIEGRLVCGKEAVGHIQQPQSIIHTISVILSKAKNPKRDPSSLGSSG